MGRDELVIAQMRIGATNPVNFLALAGAERFLRVEAPDAFQQALLAQHFVEAGDAPGIVVRNIEQRGVGVGDFNGAAQQFRCNRFAAAGGAGVVRSYKVLRSTSPICVRGRPAIAVMAGWSHGSRIACRIAATTTPALAASSAR